MHSRLDSLIINFDAALRTCAGSIGTTARPSPASKLDQSDQGATLDEKQNVLAARLMRVNHCGEVCAQALYQGQALSAKSQNISDSMKQAAKDELDHLSWCETRLNELDSHVSYLNPVMFGLSFTMGLLTGKMGDKISLGFVAATEEGVGQHLAEHLTRLPPEDAQSRAILTAMKQDEIQHMQVAVKLGATPFPATIKKIMHQASKLMTKTTYWL
ncbi:MAG: 2-polyprenyl-3-methyl-6-methoxy-1,4-benzoquinone monooxygenase [Pseudomonadales bacterium]|nr:2-polyprenyl-3-methyl-6-methoxy-1,4-benzoquinone monooxygenase [Pseudomonadales bacterium]